MNDIFNPYSKFMIVYIDDALLFLKSITKHFNNLQKFLNIIKQNKFVVSTLKMMSIKNTFLRVQYILRINNLYH
jgi:glutathionyl-hydroquinone reductase